MEDETWIRLRRMLGEPSLRYLTACENAPLSGEDMPAGLSSDQLEALRQLGELLPAAIAELHGMQKDLVIEQRLTIAAGTKDESYSATEVRRLAGGVGIGLSSDDPVINAVLQLLEDAYPFLLMRRTHPLIGRVPTRYHKHPVERRFEQLVDADPDLSKLFSERSQHTGRGGPYIGPRRAGGVQLWGFAAHLVTKAWELARLESALPSADAVAKKVPFVVNAVRRAARGKTVTLPARAGLAGVLLPEGCDSVEFDGLRVRRSDDRDKWFISNTTLEGQVGGRGPDGDPVLIDLISPDERLKLERRAAQTPQKIDSCSVYGTSRWNNFLTTLRARLQDSPDGTALVSLIFCHPDSVVSGTSRRPSRT